MRYLIYLILVVSTSLHAGSIHKWVDENGNVHYGDSPPVAAKTESISVQSAPSNPGKALPRLSTEEADVASGDVSNDQAESICESARNDLDIISNSTRIQLRQTDGTLRYLSPDEVDQRKAKAEAEVDRFCN